MLSFTLSCSFYAVVAVVLQYLSLSRRWHLYPKPSSSFKNPCENLFFTLYTARLPNKLNDDFWENITNIHHMHPTKFSESCQLFPNLLNVSLLNLPDLQHRLYTGVRGKVRNAKCLERLPCFTPSIKTGEMTLPHSDMSVPALLGMEYPDPVGSGLSVPVLGCQSDLFGNKIPLAGTMEDPGGKGNKDKDNIQSFPNIKRIICKSGLKIRCSLYLTGLVAIRYGAQTVDPVTEVLAPVVGARLDVSRKKIVPVTSFYWLMMADQTDNIQVGTAVTVSCHWGGVHFRAS